MHFSSRFDLPVIRFIGPKGRGASDPTVTLDASRVEGVGIALILSVIDRLTARLRRTLDENHPDRTRLLLHVPRRGRKVVKNWCDKDLSLYSAVAYNALKSFISDNRLAPFTLNQIKPTILDEAQLVSGDLLSATSLGRHRNPETAWNHYTSDGTRKRYLERIGEVYFLRERWQQSGGLIDPRLRFRTGDMDAGAATPGFLCFDPFDSPRPNQKNGRLCTAYGECPSCPLAAANGFHGPSAALYLGLRSAIFRSQETLSPRSWHSRWEPIMQDLDGLLSKLEPAILEEAVKLNITLPNVG
jgi:hypothetical protein